MRDAHIHTSREVSTMCIHMLIYCLLLPIGAPRMHPVTPHVWVCYVHADMCIHPHDTAVGMATQPYIHTLVQLPQPHSVSQVQPHTYTQVCTSAICHTAVPLSPYHNNNNTGSTQPCTYIHTQGGGGVHTVASTNGSMCVQEWQAHIGIHTNA